MAQTAKLKESLSPKFKLLNPEISFDCWWKADRLDKLKDTYITNIWQILKIYRSLASKWSCCWQKRENSVKSCLKCLNQLFEQAYFCRYRYILRRTCLPKSRVVRKQSPNGEIHFIFSEAKFVGTRKNAEYFDEAEIRKIMKKEAVKPLLLLREEWRDKRRR